MTTAAPHGALDEVLVSPLRADARRGAQLARLHALPPPMRTVLTAYYLQGRSDEAVAEQCRVTPRELRRLRADALTALGRGRVGVRAVARQATPYGAGV